MPIAALVVHQLRYVLTYGSAAGGALQEQGHAYLHSLVPWASAAVAVAGGTLVVEAAARLRRHDSTVVLPGFRRSWSAFTAVLVAAYVTQEWLEGALAHGHPTGFAGVFGGGGYWAVPASIVVALALTWLMRAGARLVAVLVTWCSPTHECGRDAPILVGVPGAGWVPGLIDVTTWSPRGPPRAAGT